MSHLSDLTVAGVPTMGMGCTVLTTGRVYFVDSTSSAKSNTAYPWGQRADQPFSTIHFASTQCRANK